jgi:hypothetical protein
MVDHEARRHPQDLGAQEVDGVSARVRAKWLQAQEDGFADLDGCQAVANSAGSEPKRIAGLDSPAPNTPTQSR